MESVILNVVYPPGHGAQSKEKTFLFSDSVATLAVKAVEVGAQSSVRDELVVVLVTNPSH